MGRLVRTISDRYRYPRNYKNLIPTTFAILTLALGNFAKAAIAMIPNLFPVVLLFGALGWSGKAIDIGTVMTASIAIGIAVDDTLHFITMYQKALASSLTQAEAIQNVYQHCGSAILKTTVVCVFGMAVFSLNSFVPTARFSWMMAGLLALALVGDLILLPSILLSPLGYIFVSQQRTTSAMSVRPQRPSEAELDHDRAIDTSTP